MRAGPGMALASGVMLGAALAGGGHHGRHNRGFLGGGHHGGFLGGAHHGGFLGGGRHGGRRHH